MAIKRHSLFNCLAINCLMILATCYLSPPQNIYAQEVQPEQPQEQNLAIVDNLAKSQNVTLDFKDADIRNVLKIISYKSGANIVTTPEVMGNISIRLVDVPWEQALDVILKTYGFGYDKQANIFTVAPIEKLTALKKQEVELAQVQPTSTEVFNLKYIDALDAKKALDPQLSPRGKITVLEMTGQAGWEFGTGELGKRERVIEERLGRSKVLIISDISPVLDKIKEVIEQIDVRPQQVLIETRIMEINTDRLRDIGFDWATGASGAESSTISTTPISKQGGVDNAQVGVHMLGDQITPSVFGPKESSLTTSNAGLKLLFKKLTGAQFETILHALEEDVHTNTLSAPRIMTLNNQEATILIGTKYPILKTEVSGESANTTTTLDYYQDIGIQLNVVPQIGANNCINMVVHPAVSSYTGTDASITSAKYPIIDIREAETRVLMSDGETVVIGGLLKDIKSKQIIGVPFLSKIPILGFFFRRETIDTQKVDLLIFITAHIVKEDTFSPEEIAKLEERLGRGPVEK
ncbi:MAG: type IV pilus secretin PilQ [Candidatus Omnitrophica bacterium]|nr:type IV pilus secretin PilQ [Candidatus Omnitrophota bacterium]MBU4472720.1 type IV pilus secretin PilQ [Candidatus Omnitrophota bacterium]MCG2706395.1 type IV pilus secretin PilQ [Candidatus Omnitrophota bacterium]